MCGIVGVLDINSHRKISRDTIETMVSTIIHRGPDGKGVYVEDFMGMGMRRLAIIDVDSGGQPITNEDSTLWIVFNGEIYNHNALRGQLQKKGHRFKTNSDTEVVLHLYEEYKEEALQYLNGMFAFSIWDCEKKELFVARDRLGIKPLFWSNVNNYFVFGSEIKALMASSLVSSEIDWNGFDAYFAYNYIPAPLTIFRQVHKLLPGHYIKISRSGICINQYWDVDFSDKMSGSDEEICEGFEDVFSQAVKMRLMAEVPLGAFLSGGIDSGYVVAAMAQNSTQPVNSFTIGFGGNTGDYLDERPFAESIARKYLCNHKNFEVVPNIREAVDATIKAFDEPFADDGAIPTYHICEQAARKVTVILTGLGGDENFAGYERYLGFWLSRYFQFIPQSLYRGLIWPIINGLKEHTTGNSRINHLKRFVWGLQFEPSKRYQSYQSVMSANQRRMLYSSDIVNEIDFSYVDSLGMKYFNALEKGDILDRALYQDLKMYLPDDILALSDRMGMFHSLELRVPFVDHQVVEYCARIPNRLKIKRGEKKFLLKKAGYKCLPKAVIDHRKQGFCSPMATWLRGDLRNEIDGALSRRAIEESGFFNFSRVKTLVDEHMELMQMNEKALFALLIFQKWFNYKNSTVGYEGKLLKNSKYRNLG